MAPKKAKKEAAPAAKRPRADEVFPLREDWLGAGEHHLNDYCKHIIMTMWAGKYTVTDIVRRFADTKRPVSEKAVAQLIARDGQDLRPGHCGRPVTYFQKTYISCYRRRLQAVIKNKGFPTKY